MSFIGYVAQTLTVESASPIRVSLDIDAQLVDEVVVVGYGRQKKKVSTGSISKVTAKDIEGIAVPDVTSTLEGLTSGLIVNESSGQPGSGKSILIRGISTNGDNSPLYIVDGVQLGNIDNINPSDIESVDVLKDAASSAIYGARAANGVVIITTKNGSKGDASITYSASYLNSQPWKLPSMLGAEDYVILMREKFANSNQTSALDVLGFPNFGDPLTASTNWMEEIFNPAQVINHRITASGDNKHISFDYWDQNGVIGGEKSNYKRYAMRYNSSKKIKDFLTVGQNLYLNRTQNNNIGTNSAFGGVQSDAFAYDPLTPIYDDEADFGFAQSPWVQKEYINPLSRLYLAGGDNKSDQIIGNVYIEYEPVEGLRLKTDGGFDLNWYDYRYFTPTYYFHPAAQNLSNDVGQGLRQLPGLPVGEHRQLHDQAAGKAQPRLPRRNVVPDHGVPPGRGLLSGRPVGRGIQPELPLHRCWTGHHRLGLWRCFRRLRHHQYVRATALQLRREVPLLRDHPPGRLLQLRREQPLRRLPFRLLRLGRLQGGLPQGFGQDQLPQGARLLGGQWFRPHLPAELRGPHPERVHLPLRFRGADPEHGHGTGCTAEPQRPLGRECPA